MIFTATSLAVCAILLLSNKTTANELMGCVQSIKSIPQKIEQFPRQLQELRPKLKLRLRLKVNARAGESRFRRFINKRKVVFSKEERHRVRRVEILQYQDVIFGHLQVYNSFQLHLTFDLFYFLHLVQLMVKII